jgi:hypothetical protein
LSLAYRCYSCRFGICAHPACPLLRALRRRANYFASLVVFHSSCVDASRIGANWLACDPPLDRRSCAMATPVTASSAFLGSLGGKLTKPLFGIGPVRNDASKATGHSAATGLRDWRENATCRRHHAELTSLKTLASVRRRRRRVSRNIGRIHRHSQECKFNFPGKNGDLAGLSGGTPLRWNICVGLTAGLAAAPVGQYLWECRAR